MRIVNRFRLFLQSKKLQKNDCYLAVILNILQKYACAGPCGVPLSLYFVWGIGTVLVFFLLPPIISLFFKVTIQREGSIAVWRGAAAEGAPPPAQAYRQIKIWRACCIAPFQVESHHDRTLVRRIWKRHSPEFWSAWLFWSDLWSWSSDLLRFDNRSFSKSCEKHIFIKYVDIISRETSFVNPFELTFLTQMG